MKNGHGKNAQVTSTAENPYVGPRAFHIGEPLYGRRREVRNLLDQLIPDRIVLLYSPSGAGKTSLIQAGLIPKLREEGFQEQPILRVGLEPPPELETAELPALVNRYVLSVLLSLEEALPEERRTDLLALSRCRLDVYLDRLQDALGPAANLLLMFDQFEEALTLDPTDAEAKKAFFRQLGATLDNPQRWALFSMREDHVPALDPFLRWLPTELRHRFRLDLLDLEAARKAIREPAGRVGVEFTEGAVTRLFDDLRRLRVQHPGGRIEELLGPTVEPVQLQVVCHRLWQEPRPDSACIDEQDIHAVGDLDSALRGYYQECLDEVSRRFRIPERRIRVWFDEQLISPHGLRTQILKDLGDASLPSKLIDTLVDRHLLRAERRRHATWLELSHDRLIEPIREDNRVWRRANRNVLEQQAHLWRKKGRRRDLLLRGKLLRESRAWAKDHPDQVTSLEREFLISSHQGSSRKFILSLIVLLVAMAVAWRVTDRDKRKFRSREVGRTALLNLDRPDRAALLGLQASNLAVERQGRFSLLEVLERHPYLFSQLHGHTEDVRSLVFSSDGEHLVSGAKDGIRLWSLRSRQPVARLAAEEAGAVQDLALHPAGALLAAIHGDRSCRLWDLETRREIGRLDLGENFYASAVDFHPEGRLLAIGGQEGELGWLENGVGKVVFWDLQASRADGQPLVGHSREVASIAFSPSGRILASGGADSRIVLWSVSDRKAWLQPLEGHTQQIRALGFSPNGRRLISASDDRTVLSWDLANRPISMRALYSHQDGVSSIALDPNGRYLVSGGRDLSVKLWDFERNRELAVLEGHGDQVYSVAFSPDGETFASGSGDDKVLLWKLDRSLPLEPSLYARSQLLFEEPSKLTALTDRGFLASWGIEDRIGISGEWIGELRADGARLSPDGELLALIPLPDFSIYGHEILLLNRALKTEGRLTHPRDTGVAGLAFSPESKLLVSATTDGRLYLWDTGTSRLIDSSESEHRAQVCSLAIAPDRRTLVSGDDGGSIFVWDLDGLEPRGPLTGPDARRRKGACSLAFHPTEPLLATGDFESNLTLWNLGTLRVTMDIPDAHLGWQSKKITSLAFNVDGTLLASGGWRNILLWDIEAGRRIGPALQAHAQDVTDLAFSTSGYHLASSSEDRIMLWDLDLESWQDRACEIANRNLTRAEWRQYIGSDLPYRRVCPDLPGPPD